MRIHVSLTIDTHRSHYRYRLFRLFIMIRFEKAKSGDTLRKANRVEAIQMDLNCINTKSSTILID